MRRAGIGDAEAEAGAMYAGLGAGLLELLWLGGAAPSMRTDILRRHVVLDEALDDALRVAAEHGPVVIAASHTANWELIAYGAAQVLAARGVSLAVVVKPVSVGALHSFCMNLRRACGLTLIAPQGALRAARSLLTAGHAVAMPIDQVPDRASHGVSVSFLGATALADRAPMVLARSVGATLIVVGATRDGAVQRAHLLANLAPKAHEAPSWTADTTRECTAVLERFVRRNPSSWLWLHRRWRAPLEVREGRWPDRLSRPGIPANHR